MGINNFQSDFSIDGLYHQLNDIHSQLAQNRENIALLSSKLDLATAQNISDILVNISNHDFQIKSIDQQLNIIKNNIDISDGKINQIYLELSELKKQLTDFQLKINNELNEHKYKLFSPTTRRELIVGILLAIILAIGGSICKTLWDSFLEKETAHRQSQIQLIEKGK